MQAAKGPAMTSDTTEEDGPGYSTVADGPEREELRAVYTIGEAMTYVHVRRGSRGRGSTLQRAVCRG